jgi:hypothetical protein
VQAGIGDYELAKPPGRSYRYYNATPLYHFGHGLSFTSFSHSCTRDAAHGPAAARAPEQPYRFVCELANTGSRAGDEVLQVYHALTLILTLTPTPTLTLTLTLYPTQP